MIIWILLWVHPAASHPNLLALLPPRGDDELLRGGGGEERAEEGVLGDEQGRRLRPSWSSP